MNVLLLLLFIAYGCFTLGFATILWSKPLYVHIGNERRLVRVPAFRLVIVVFFGTWVFLSLVPHLLCRFVGLRGFWDKSDGSYKIQNPFRRAR